MLIEYIRKGSKKSKKKVHPKRGVMVSFAEARGPDGKGKVLIGFSLCHSKYDRYDFIKETRVPHHGFKIALERATKWVDLEEFTIKGPGSFPYQVGIPESIKKNLYKFITRATKYYRDKQLPIWAVMFKQNMDHLYQDRRKPVPGDGSVKTAKGVREAACCS